MRRPPSAARQPCRDLLKQPAVAIRIAEGRERTVSPVLRRRPGYTTGVVKASAERLLVEDLAHLDATGEEVLTRGFDVGDGEVRALGRPRHGRRDVPAKLDRAAGAGGRELNQTQVLAAVDVGVEPPPEACVELLRALDVRDRQDQHLELELPGLQWRGARRAFAAHLAGAPLASIGDDLVGSRTLSLASA